VIGARRPGPAGAADRQGDLSFPSRSREGQRKGKIKRSRGPKSRLPNPTGIRLEVPRLPRATEPDSLPKGIAGPRSGTFRGPPHCFGGGAGIYRRVRQSAPSRPFLKPLDRKPAFGSGPKQVAVKFSLEVDPTLAGCGLQPPPCHLIDDQTEHPSTYIFNHFLPKNKRPGNFFGRKIGGLRWAAHFSSRFKLQTPYLNDGG
jgi:hypothetical protein